eukprot:gene20346-23111_t
MAREVAVTLLTIAEEIPPFDNVARLMNKILQICDQCKCNEEASHVLQERFCRLTEHLFSEAQGLAHRRPEKASFKRASLSLSALQRGSKPQETFESLDRDMTRCLNDLSMALHVTALEENEKIYDVVCNIQAKVDELGGPAGLLANPARLSSLAQEIGADAEVLKAEMVHWLESLNTQVNIVLENSEEMKTKLEAIHLEVKKIQRTAAVPDLASLQLTSFPVVDRTPEGLLGEGLFGKVFKGVYDHVQVAVKEVSVRASEEMEFKREVAMHQKVGYLPGVVRLFGANFITVPRCIVLERAAGTLHDALHKNYPAIDRTLPSKLSILAQVCSTMAAISGMGILHRDIKSSNVLLFFNHDRVYAKLSDFGLTRMANEGISTSLGASPKGTLPYMAPEVFSGRYSTASDMYAFAVMLNEVLTEQVPFPKCDFVQIMWDVGTFRIRPNRYKADVGDSLGCKLMHLTEQCWHQDHSLRLNFYELADELNDLLRKAADAARVGNQASTTAPHAPTCCGSGEPAQSLGIH